MNKGENLLTSKYLELFNSEELEKYVDEVLDRDIKVFKDTKEIRTFLGESFTEYTKDLTDKDKQSLRYYSGINHDKVNAILRGNWDYRKNFMYLDKETESKYKYYSNEIDQVFAKPFGIPTNILTFRRVPLEALSNYGINTKEDLLSLKNKYLLDLGFTSTSLLNFDYLDQQFKAGEVKLKIVIPKECEEGIPLLSEDVTYHLELEEFLLGKNALFKVIDVDIRDKDPVINVVYIPRKVREKLNTENINIKK